MEEEAPVLSLINHLSEQSRMAGQAAPALTLPSSPFLLQGKRGFPGGVLLLQLHAPLTI